MTEIRSAVGSVMLSTDRMEQTLAFYADALGFRLKFRDGDEWATLDGNGATVALAGPREQSEDAIALAIKVADLDAAIKAGVEAGGTLVSSAASGGHEIRAQLRDPEGHLLMLYTPVKG